MNHNLHRIVFNKNRGQLMAVAETASSQGKAASGEHSASGGASGGAPGSFNGCALPGLLFATLRSVCLGVFASLGMVFFTAGGAGAQIIADRTAPGNQQPTVLGAGNGVPLVNIQTPSAAGVSRNTYSQFDVHANGAILNNSRTAVQTQLGGYVQGNPWLATGPARVILNEVNSANPSYLRGYTEVAGQRAEVIIANPAGINIDGAGFINASRVTLTTGTAIVNGGSLDGYRVERGSISIGGSGLDASQTDYTGILARAVQVNAGIWAKDLRVVTGANQIDAAQTGVVPVAGSGAVPGFALDVAQLGGMYAGKIMLIGTEAGVGVSNAGVIGASAGEVVLQTNGWLTNSGSIQASGNAQITTGGSVSNSGTVYANGNTGLAAVGGIANTGLVAAQGNISVQATDAGAQISASKDSVIAAGLNPDGTLRTSGDLMVSGTAAVALNGQTIAGGNATVSGAGLDLSGGKLTAQTLTLSAAAGDLDASRADISTQGVLAISAAQTVRTDGASVAAHQLSLKAHNLSNVAGAIVQTGNTDLAIQLSSPTGTLDNTRGRIAVNSQHLTLGAHTLINTEGRIEHAGTGTLAINASALNDQRGQITGNGALSITTDSINHQNAHTLAKQVTVAAGNLNNHQGEIAQVGSGQTNLSVRGAFDNSAGSIASNGNASISAQTLDNAQGRITSAQSADVTATAGLNNSDGSIAAGQNLSLASGSIDNTQGVLQASLGNTTLNVGNLNNHAGSIYAAGSLSTTAVNVTSTGSLYAAGSQMLTASGAVSNSGVIAARGNTTITADNLNSAATSLLGAGIASDGSLGNAGHLSVRTTGALTAHGQNLAAGDATMSGALLDLSSSQTSASAITLTATAGNVNTSAATVAAPGTLRVTAKTQNAQTLDNRSGALSAGQLDLNVANLNNAQGQIIQTGTGNTTIALSSPTGTLDNTQGRIAVNSQNLALSANTLTNTDGRIEHAGSGTLAIDATVLNDQRGRITGNGVLSLTAGSVDHRNASTIAQQVAIAASSLNNQQGEIIQTGSGQTRITATDFINNTAGRIETNGAAVISTGTLDNTQGRITSGQSVFVTTSGSLNNTAGTLAASQNLAVVGGHVDNARGTLQAVTGNITLQAGDLSNTAGAVYAGADLTTSASNVVNTGSLYAGGNQVLAVSGTVSNTGVIAAQGDASITADSMSSSATGLLGAGIRADGSQSTAGHLRVRAANGLVAKGQNLAAGSAVLTGSSVDLTGSQTSAASIAITATAGNVTTSAATVTTPGTLGVSAKAQDTQSLVNSQGTISAGQLNLDVANLNNAQGQIIQTGTGNTTIALSSSTGTLDNTQGRIAVNSQNLSLGANTLTNTDGKIEHAGTGALAINANTLNGQRGQITGNGALIVNTGVFNHDNASTVAQQISLSATSLSNRSGEIVQTGSGLTTLTALGAIDNSAGVIASNGITSVSGQTLSNQGGTIQATGASNLSLSVNAGLDNSGAGKLAAGGDFNLAAGALNNNQGSITAGGSLGAALAQGLSNTQGLIAANGDVTLAAASVDNARGTIASVQGSATLSSTGATQNDSGKIQSALDVTLVNAGLSNAMATGATQAGSITAGRNISIQTNGQALNNAQGTIAAGQLASLQTGALNNDGGLIQAGTALSINTSSQTLSNANASQHVTGAGGITSQGTLALTTGDVNNAQGFVGAKGALTATAANISNTAGGQIVGQSSVGISSTGFDNRGGQVQTLGSLGIDAGAGSINNSASLMRSAENLSLTAAAVINSNTLGSNQGMEAKNVAITASAIANNQGAIRADNNASLTSSGRIDNTGGLISAGNTALLQDLAATKTLVISNTAGTLIAGQSAVINASSLSGDGKVLSRGDLSIALVGDFNNSGEITANRNASITTVANLGNSGKLQAGNSLSLNAQNIDNAVTGEITGAVTQVNAANALTNRGLIDGQDTHIDAATLNNLGTGRIYGDRLSIAAVTVNNDFENGRAGTIAARERLVIGAQTINNNQGALIFSAGDLAIGGSLDANRRATNLAQAINNNGSTIEALGNLSASAGQINNINTNFAYTVRLDSGVAVKEYVTSAGTFSGNAVGWELSPETFQPASNGGYVYGTGQGRIVLAGAPYANRAFQPYYSGSNAYSPPRFETDPSDSSSNVLIPGGFNYASDSTAWQLFSVAPPTAAPPGPRPVGTYSADGDPPVLIPPTAVEIAAWEAAAAPWFALQGKIDSLRASVDASAITFDGFRSYTAPVPVPTITQSTPARLLSGGAMTLNATSSLLNDQSQIVAGGVLNIPGRAVNNQAREILVDAQRSGTAYAWRNYEHGCGNFFGCDYNYNAYGDLAYVQSVLQSVTLNIGNVQSFASPASQGLSSGAQLSAHVNAGTSEGVSPVTRASVANLVATSSSNNVALGSIAQAGGQAAVAAIGLEGAASSVFKAAPVNPSLGNGTGGTALGVVTGVSATPQPMVIAAASISPQPATGGVQTVRITPVNTTVPRSSLFGINPNPEARYLVETDPRFTNYRQWLGSDYFLGALAIDPATVQKRLGDGFYEQRLISEQVAQLTGQRFLANYSSDEQEYRALMDAGITFAKAHQLRPGIALSAAQMAQLSSDIVWLVEQDVTLADGSRQKALVPQVYVRVKDGDLAPSGALLAGSSINLNLTGDLTNSGTIAGRSIVSLTADNVHNLGGRIMGDTVAVTARQDLNNLGGQITAGSALMAAAGRDINIETTTSSATNRVSSNASSNTFSHTGIDRVAGLYVTNPGGTLVASAGRDLNIIGGIVANGPTGASGLNGLNGLPPGTGAVSTPQATTVLSATRNLNLGIVTTSSSSDLTRDAQNYLRDGQSTDIGTQIRTAGNVALQAGQDLNAKAATVRAAGSLTASAGNNVNLTAGQSQSSVGFGLTSAEHSLFSKTTTTTRDTMASSTSVGSTLEGQNVLLKAGNDINVQGSAVNAQQALIVDAKRDVNITAAIDTYSESHFKESKREATGLAKGLATVIALADPVSALTPNSANQVAIAALLTKKNLANDNAATSTTSVGSQLTGGTVAVQSGRDTRVEGSALVADGDISVKAGRDLMVTTAQNTQADQSKTADKTTGLLRFEATGNTVGKREQMQAQQNTAVTNAASQIVSLGKGGENGKSGNIDLSAIGNTTITGSSVLAPGGDISISGANVLINEAHNTVTQAEQSRFKETSASVQIKSGYVDAVKGAAASIETARTAKEDTGSSRMAGLATLNAAMNVYSTANALAGSASQQGSIDQLGGNASATAAPISAISISGSIGQSKSASNSTANSSAARGSTVAAGGTLSITANGDKSTGNGNLTMIGTNASAGKEANLSATGNIDLLAAANTNDMRSSNSGSNASMGATFALGGQQNGLSFQAGAQGSKGKANGDETTYSNTTIRVGSKDAPGTLNISSGGNTTLKGATASANTVNADIKGKLVIESLQDTSNYDSKQTSVGAGVSVCVPPLCYGTMVVVSVNASKTKADSELKSVTDQSGLFAGDGGFNVKVGGHTQLTGGAIASSDQAIKDGKNTLTTATLTTRDLDNYAEASASSQGFSASSSMASQGTYGVAKAVVSNALNNADTSGSSSGQTRSAISLGTVTITDEAAQQDKTGKTAEQTVAALNRDTAGAHTAAVKPDAKAMEKKVEAQRAITQATVNEAFKFTDEAYRKIFVEKHPMYKIVKDENGKAVIDPATNKPTLVLVTAEERANLQPGPDGKINIATNGIFNSNVEAGDYANQHNTTTAPQYVIYFPEANNPISELLVAGYQKFLENPTMGLSNSTTQVMDAMNQYGTTGLQLDGHSRGAMTIGNALEAQSGQPNTQGSLSQTNINFSGPAYNAQDAANLLDSLSGNPNSTLRLQNHVNDPVGRIIGGNPGTGGTTPEGSSPAGQAIRAVTLQPNTVHNCYGSGRDGCGPLWNNGISELVPVVPQRASQK